MSKMLHRRCPLCGVVSFGTLPGRCSFGTCTAPLVREVQRECLAPVNGAGDIDICFFDKIPTIRIIMQRFVME